MTAKETDTLDHKFILNTCVKNGHDGYTEREENTLPPHHEFTLNTFCKERTLRLHRTRRKYPTSSS
jgi:hypothetical protein